MTLSYLSIQSASSEPLRAIFSLYLWKNEEAQELVVTGLEASLELKDWQVPIATISLVAADLILAVTIIGRSFPFLNSTQTFKILRTDLPIQVIFHRQKATTDHRVAEPCEMITTYFHPDLFKQTETLETSSKKPKKGGAKHGLLS